MDVINVDILVRGGYYTIDFEDITIGETGWRI